MSTFLDEFIIDNSLDQREFRNLANSVLLRNGFKSLKIDDPRLIDTNSENDNDILAQRDGIRYTIQTFLNEEIGTQHIAETVKDMENEGVPAGLIITNHPVNPEMIEIARQNNIEVWDRNKLLLLLKEN